jgi:RNA polymerase sigma-70 factor (ECF subfamily)
MADSLESLLDQLNSGDDAAVEEVFRSYEPYLRTVVRRQLSPQLRAKFDSIDVVQSVWGDVLKGFREGGMRFASVAHLRAFLVKAARNRFIDRVRQQRTAARLEQPLRETDRDALPSSPSPRASELAVAGELWDRLLARCPAEHRDILSLRRQGCTLVEIAQRTGLHEGSVRRILRNLARQLDCDEISVEEAAP